MKVYILLNQDPHSTKIFHESKKGKKTFIKEGRIKIEDKNFFSRILIRPDKKYIKIFFNKREAILNILNPTIVESIRKSFESMRSKKALFAYQLKPFFVIKAINIALNTKVKVYSCIIDQEDIITDGDNKYITNAVGIKAEKVSLSQMKMAIKRSIPAVYDILSGIGSIREDVFESLTEEAKSIALSIKSGMKEISINQINSVSMLIDAITISKELDENEKNPNIN